MAEEVKQEPTQPQGGEPHGEEPIDWEAKYKEAVAQSRKWEERSKANKDKADKWDEYQQQGMSEAEKLAQRAESAEAELAKLRADAQKRTDAKEVAKATGVPETLLLYCDDRDAMEAFAKEYGANAPSIPAAPPAPASRILRGGEGGKADTAEQFADMAEKFFRH